MSTNADPEAPTPGKPPGQYEFNAEQNALMGDLGAKMQFVGMFAVVIGALVLMGGVLTVNAAPRNPGAFIAGLLYIALGAWTRSAGSAFRDVVETRGADITHLMEALGDVRRIYTLFTWICIIAIALLAISLLLVVYWNAFPPARPVTALITHGG